MVFPTLEFVLFLAVVLAVNLALTWRQGTPAPAPEPGPPAARGPGSGPGRVLPAIASRLDARKAFLIAASYWFYAAWDWRFCLLMAGVSAIAWAGGLRADRRAVRIASIAGLLVVLGIFKYFNFFFLSLGQLLGDTFLARDLGWMRVILPVGISFYTFQAISYVMDCARGDIAPRRNPFDVALYISFFPQLVAGPIVRAADFLPQIDRPYVVDTAMRGAAVLLILSGLFKKMVVANYLSVLIVDPVFAFPDGQAWPETLAAVIGYGIQIYCDFSGYSDIAIGVALLLGYRFQRNFNQPYRARGLSDFWRRWHISLSSWIRDYLYIPLGGNRGGVARQVWTLLLTMTLAGLWHGAGWNFLVWGFLHGAALGVERGLRRVPLGPLRWLAVPVTLLIVFALWIPFRAADWEGTLAILSALTRAEGFAGTVVPPQALALIAIGLAMNWLPLAMRDVAEGALMRVPAVGQALILAAGTILLFATAQDGVAPFIYFQF
ncbi:MBOAT family O-acyltransferase [Wenxinia marina]|uniref:Probable alginate O-acetylase AlgI n=1 Tax=Wenxinia marina DSM 24838 TaxID=1123501 RepID=A0A0D0PBX3_9RHOB|nr:MBOAT family O-acyltransferase [Wenxinia marina]KIQ68976.1 putative membrane protein involved in D-alanine export [Wenxinia marina DSM 24838]GGL63640.1 alginate O-acetyltransferase [Wenxinia marina]